MRVARREPPVRHPSAGLRAVGGEPVAIGDRNGPVHGDGAAPVEMGVEPRAALGEMPLVGVLRDEQAVDVGEVGLGERVLVADADRVPRRRGGDGARNLDGVGEEEEPAHHAAPSGSAIAAARRPAGPSSATTRTGVP